MNDSVDPSLLYQHWDEMHQQMQEVALIPKSEGLTVAKMKNAIKSLTKGSNNMSSPALLDKKNLREMWNKSPDFIPGITLCMDTYGKVKLYLDKKHDILLVADYPLTLTSRGVMPIAKDVWTNWQVYANTLKDSERHMDEAQESKSISSDSDKPNIYYNNKIEDDDEDDDIDNEYS